MVAIHQFLAAVLASAAALALAGCREPPPHPPAPFRAPPRPTAPAATRGDDRTATLVVSADIVNACPLLERIRDAPAVDAPKNEWLFILVALADCMNGGDLRGRMIVLRGLPEARDVVASLLEERGVEPGRVASDMRPSRAGDERLEIALLTVGDPI
jgi:hypothetical protein